MHPLVSVALLVIGSQRRDVRGLKRWRDRMEKMGHEGRRAIGMDEGYWHRCVRLVAVGNWIARGWGALEEIIGMA